MRNRIRGLATDPLRCPRCRLHTDLCACDVLQPLSVATELIVVAHRYEVRKPTSTGRLAVLCLERARLCLRGLHGRPDDPVTCAPGRVPLLLFPCPGAVPLDEWQAGRQMPAPPVTLIVPDGTWRQAKRVPRRVPGLSSITAVTLPDVLATGSRLRQPDQPNRLATLEAIALAYGILEGRAAQDHLLNAFRTIVERTLWSNGRLTTEQATTHIPEGARQDGPIVDGNPGRVPIPSRALASPGKAWLRPRG